MKSSGSNIPWWSRIRVRTLLLGVVMSILPLILLSAYYLYFAKLDLQRSVQVQNNLLAAGMSQEVNILLAHTEESLKNLTVNLDDLKIINNEASNKTNNAGDSVWQLSFYRFLHEFPLVEEVVILDAKGEAVQGINRFQVFHSVDHWVDPAELKGLTIEQPYYSPIDFSQSGIPTVKIVVPFASAFGDTFSGGYGIRLRLTGLLTVVKTPNPQSKTDLFVVDSTGRLIADSDISRVLQKVDVRKSYTVQNFLQYKDPGKLPTLNEYQSYSGQRVLGAYEVLPRNGWGVMVEQPVAIAFAPINQLIARFIFFIVVAFGIAILLSIFQGLSITRPIEQLEKAVRTVSRGQYDERVPVQREDELGQLARTFNEMVERLEVQSTDLLQEKERLDTIVQGIGAGLALLNHQRSVTWMNSFLADWIKADLPQSITVDEVISELNRSNPQKVYSHQVYKLKHSRPNEPMFLMLVQDITEQRRMEDLMIQADKLSALGLMASGFAHEINNPLAIIQGYAEDLQEQFESNHGEFQKSERIDRYLRTIRKHSERARRITQSLLNFSRKSEWKVEEMDVTAIVEESISLMEPILKKKQIAVVKIWDGKLPKITGDALQLVQVFVNLISNALDALPQGGELRIKVERENHSELRITVQDNGEGIPPEILPKLFDPFFTTKDIGKGTGLGLAITYGIVARMGGAIRIESKPGEGTEVILILPIQDLRQKRGLTGDEEKQ